MEAFLPVIVLFVLFFLNIPIGFALMGSALFYFMFLNTTMAMNMVIQQFVTAVESFPYLAVPFFIMVGSVMNYSGISEELMNMAEVLAGHMKGGLAQVNCLLSAMMGGISGSANADAAMESKILVPEMIKKGFSKPFSAAVTAASSAVSPVIPPGTNICIDCECSGRRYVLSRIYSGNFDDFGNDDYRTYYFCKKRLSAFPRTNGKSV